MSPNNNKKSIGVIQSTIDTLSKRHDTPMFLYFLLVALYMLVTVFLRITSSSQGVVTVASFNIPVYTFAGVLVSLANICMMLLPVFYGKLGFVTALIILSFQTPLIIIGVAKGNITSIPGIFSNILAIVAIVVIHLKNVAMQKYQLTLRDQAVTDTLTGLPNSFVCKELVDDLVKRGTPHVLVSIDLNGFKNINDTMGFSFGDKVLTEIASRWMALANSGKTGTNDFITRVSGDVFTLVIRGFKSDEDAVNTIKQYESALSSRLTVDEYDFFINGSFGYVKFPEDADNKDALMSYAELAMKEVKRANSSDHIKHFTEDLLKVEKTLEIENKIRYALENDLIICNLQPQYDMEHKLRGFEALARMKDKDGQIISPTEFIPVAEDVGLIDKIDSQVFRIAAGFLSNLTGKTDTDVIISVNVSARHMMKNDFIEEVKRIINESGAPASQIEIEITESVMIDSAEKALHVINELRAIGVTIAIDDFGTGYSSLSYLNKFPANLLKIDKSFIDRMNQSDSSKQYVAAIISIGHILGFDVISEGVEDESQLITLREIGCDLIQGFVWGKPLPLEEAGKLVLA
ncbi:MAG: bifunctional diguanylate cyclase/phosphodiesterase [Lachnospiraceae bacterium]|nr:bifunctional diguanylate cyclase/phosphodiesterase [Lachnospiraceae bacterium]